MDLSQIMNIRTVDGTTLNIDSSCTVGRGIFFSGEEVLMEALTVTDRFEETFIPIDKIISITFTRDMPARIDNENFEAIDVLEEILSDYGPNFEEYPEIVTAIRLAQKVLKEQAEAVRNTEPWTDYPSSPTAKNPCEHAPEITCEGK